MRTELWASPCQEYSQSTLRENLGMNSPKISKHRKYKFYFSHLINYTNLKEKDNEP